jgi:hypothetical protein
MVATLPKIWIGCIPGAVDGEAPVETGVRLEDPTVRSGLGVTEATALLGVIGMFSKSINDCKVYCGDCAAML